MTPNDHLVLWRSGARFLGQPPNFDVRRFSFSRVEGRSDSDRHPIVLFYDHQIIVSLLDDRPFVRLPLAGYLELACLPSYLVAICWACFRGPSSA